MGHGPTAKRALEMKMQSALTEALDESGIRLSGILFHKSGQDWSIACAQAEQPEGCAPLPTALATAAATAAATVVATSLTPTLATTFESSDGLI